MNIVVSEPDWGDGVTRGDVVEVLVEGGRWPVRLEPGVKEAAIYDCEFVP